jgi:hypothetical protein
MSILPAVLCLKLIGIGKRALPRGLELQPPTSRILTPTSSRATASRHRRRNRVRRRANSLRRAPSNNADGTERTGLHRGTLTVAFAQGRITDHICRRESRRLPHGPTPTGAETRSIRSGHAISRSTYPPHRRTGRGCIVGAVQSAIHACDTATLRAPRGVGTGW